jgi:hypothetical protein
MKHEPIDRAVYDADRLIASHPPRWHDRNKERVFEIARSSGFPFEGRIVYSRWREEQLPETVPPARRIEVRRGVFEYAPPTEPSTVAWHMNFADPHLFTAYGSGLMAQDELQVAEHPILGSLLEALRAEGLRPVTVDDRGRPTPVTVAGIQRRCAIDTRPNTAAGRPGGLYGNAFARAPAEEVKAATRPLCPPTISNILAIAAPAYGYGTYTREQIDYVLAAAHTGFLAAQRESATIQPTCARTEIHTGFWGCGAFGGNRTLMTILQALSGALAGVELVFWSFDPAGIGVVEKALRQYERLAPEGARVQDVIARLLDVGFQWGESDGN